jgi:hypothetical protein
LCGASIIDHLFSEENASFILYDVLASSIIVFDPFEEKYQTMNRPKNIENRL